jgi:hypothetical protein
MAEYRLGSNRRSITCLTCNRTSFNLKDVRYLWCSYCNKRHASDPNQPQPPLTEAEYQELHNSGRDSLPPPPTATP